MSYTTDGNVVELEVTEPAKPKKVKKEPSLKLKQAIKAGDKKRMKIYAEREDIKL